MSEQIEDLHKNVSEIQGLWLGRIDSHNVAQKQLDEAIALLRLWTSSCSCKGDAKCLSCMTRDFLEEDFLKTNQVVDVLTHGEPKGWPDATAMMEEWDLDQAKAEVAKWMSWSKGQYPEDTTGDVIAAWPDGSVMLDDSITVWNPIRALAFVSAGGVLQKARV